MWNSFFERDGNRAGDLRFFEKDVRRTHHDIVFAFRQRRIIAAKRDLLFAGALLDLDLVTKRNRRDERLDFVKAIAAAAENSQRKIDLRWSDDLHIFVMSSEVEDIPCCQSKLTPRDSSTSLGMTTVADKIIVALDVATKEKALDLVEQLRSEISFFKIGLQLYTAEGPEIVCAVLATGVKVWLDLKLYDIPNTVARAVESASTLGVQMLTIHLSGGSEMIRAATAARANDMLVLGVTVLTSATEQTLREIGITNTVEDQVIRLAKLGAEAGIDGVVASPHEIKILRREFGEQNQNCCPGNSAKLGRTGRSETVHDAARSI